MLLVCRAAAQYYSFLSHQCHVIFGDKHCTKSTAVKDILKAWLKYVEVDFFFFPFFFFCILNVQ